MPRPLTCNIVSMSLKVWAQIILDYERFVRIIVPVR